MCDDIRLIYFIFAILAECICGVMCRPVLLFGSGEGRAMNTVISAVSLPIGHRQQCYENDRKIPRFQDPRGIRITRFI